MHSFFRVFAIVLLLCTIILQLNDFAVNAVEESRSHQLEDSANENVQENEEVEGEEENEEEEGEEEGNDDEEEENEDGNEKVVEAENEQIAEAENEQVVEAENKQVVEAENEQILEAETEQVEEKKKEDEEIAREISPIKEDADIQLFVPVAESERESENDQAMEPFSSAEEAQEQFSFVSNEMINDDISSKDDAHTAIAAPRLMRYDEIHANQFDDLNNEASLDERMSHSIGAIDNITDLRPRESTPLHLGLNANNTQALQLNPAPAVAQNNKEFEQFENYKQFEQFNRLPFDTRPADYQVLNSHRDDDHVPIKRSRFPFGKVLIVLLIIAAAAGYKFKDRLPFKNTE